MLSIIIPTLNAEKDLPASLAALMPALMEDMISEVIIVDGGSRDDTEKIADASGAKFISCETTGRGHQLALGAKNAKSNWYLFLHADSELEEGWHHEIKKFLSNKSKPEHTKVAAFTFALKDKGWKPAFLTNLVALRCKLFSLPYGDQGLLIDKQTYEEVGGFQPLPLMEDVDLIRRLKQSPQILKSRAFTSAIRYQTDGYIKRSLRNLFCLGAYYKGTPAEKIKGWYETSNT